MSYFYFPSPILL